MKRPGPSISKRRHQSGQATMVEFALIGGAFFMLLFATIQAAEAVFTYNSICEASREAVRYAIVHGPNSPSPSVSPYSDIKQIAINAVPNLNLTTNNVAVNLLNDPKLPTLKDVQVTVTYNYALAIPFTKSGTWTLTATSQMLVSQ
jgi:Flp pilus assembly protein TadG